MIEKLVSTLQLIVLEHGAVGVFFAALIEEIIAPIPSAIIPLAAGFFLLPVEQTLWEIIIGSALLVALPTSLGLTLGSLFLYSLGFFGGKPIILKWGKWFGLNWNEMEGVEKKLIRGWGDEIALFVLRAVPLVPNAAISGFCGLVRYPFQNFVLITLLGSFVRAFGLGIIGWQVGEAYAAYAGFISDFEKYIFAVILAAAALILVWLNFRKRRNGGGSRADAALPPNKITGKKIQYEETSL